MVTQRALLAFLARVAASFNRQAQAAVAGAEVGVDASLVFFSVVDFDRQRCLRDRGRGAGASVEHVIARIRAAQAYACHRHRLAQPPFLSLKAPVWFAIFKLSVSM